MMISRKRGAIACRTLLPLILIVCFPLMTIAEEPEQTPLYEASKDQAVDELELQSANVDPNNTIELKAETLMGPACIVEIKKKIPVVSPGVGLILILTLLGLGYMMIRRKIKTEQPRT